MIYTWIWVIFIRNSNIIEFSGSNRKMGSKGSPSKAAVSTENGKE